MWDDQAGPLAERLPRAPLRPARPRRLAGARRPVHDRRPRRRPARAARPPRDRARLAVRAVARRHDRDVGGERGARADRAARALLHLGAARARRRTGRSGRAPSAASASQAIADAGARALVHAGVPRRRPPAVDRLDAMLRATPAEGYAGCCEAIRDMDLTRPARRASRAPTLVIAGADDPATPPRHGQAIANADARRAARDRPGRRPPGQRRAARGHHRQDRWPMSRDDGRRHEGPARGARRRARRPRRSSARPTSPPTSRTSSPATRGARSGPGRASTAARAAASR